MVKLLLRLLESLRSLANEAHKLVPLILSIAVLIAFIVIGLRG